MTDDREAIEKLIRTAFSEQDHSRAATLAIEHYGPELLGFLISQLRDADAASEVFADFSANFWAALPTFEWRCSARTFAYKLARCAAARHRRTERRRKRVTPLEHASQFSLAIERVRTATHAYKRTDVKDRFQELRAQLPDEDQSLLILRVDRGLSWLELAEVMLEGEELASEAQLKTEAARLRKRFQLAKEKLRALIVEAGLLES